MSILAGGARTAWDEILITGPSIGIHPALFMFGEGNPETQELDPCTSS